MSRPELDALPEACSLIAEELALPVAGMHSAIASRVFRFVGPPGRAVGQIHDTVAGGVYAAIPRGAGVLGAIGGAAWGVRSTGDSPVSESAPGSWWQAVINASWGDRLAERGNKLATETSLRVGRHRASPEAIAGQLTASRSHLVVLLHGLGQTESCWTSPGGLATALRDDAELVPVLVRYNSGRATSDLGEEVALLIEGLWQACAFPDAKISFVGFSQGGLVARAALAAAVRQGMASAGAIRHIISVGTPHAGSYLAKAAGFVAAGLDVTKTTQPLAGFLNRRSASIKEMAWASGLERLPQLPGVRHHFAASTVTGDQDHPVGVLVGDLVVRVTSATAPAVAADNVSVVGGRRHVDLLTDDDVRERLVGWLRDSGDD